MQPPSIRRIIFFIAALTVIVIVMVILIPPARARIVTFLDSQASSIHEAAHTPPASSPTPPILPTSTQEVPTTYPTAAYISNIDLSSNSEILQVSGKARWQILPPSFLPEGYRFESVYYDQDNQLVSLSFMATRKLPGSDLTETKSVTLTEAKRNDMIPLVISPLSTATAVTVDGTSARYIIGAWETMFVSNPGEANGGHMESHWRNDLPVQNIYWQVRDLYLVLITDDPLVVQGDLVNMADSIR
jgi:hypothetical protein